MLGYEERKALKCDEAREGPTCTCTTEEALAAAYNGRAALSTSEQTCGTSCQQTTASHWACSLQGSVKE